MSTRNQNIIIIASVLALVCLTFYLLFDIKEVPDVQWDQDYKYESKEPHGGWIFQELIHESFGTDRVTYFEDIDSFAHHDKQLYINYGYNITIPLKKQKELLKFIRHGNVVLFICEYLDSNSDTLSAVPWGVYAEEYNNDDEDANNEDDYYEDDNSDDNYDNNNEDALYDSLSFGDSLYIDSNEEDYEDGYEEDYADGDYDDRSWDDHDSYLQTYYDSLTRIRFPGEDSTEYIFKYYHNSLTEAVTKEIKGVKLNLQDPDKHQSLALISDSLSVFYKRTLTDGAIYFYADPANFSNISATQADYLGHFNKVFSHFDATHVILDKPRKSDLIERQHGDKSPLQYILSQPALAWAYYITLLGVLLYIIFRGKRKQRIIPITQVNQNTSLEYVDTISQLFLSQKQNQKLIEHIESIFYHKVKKKYYLDRNHKDFKNAFIQKSKIDKNDISYVLDKFKNAHDGFEFTDEQLHSLYKKLELIYTKWK